MNELHRRVAPALAALTLVLFALACARFVAQPGLASFADDSVSYLVLAQGFAPFTPAPAAVADAFAREAFYPPLFPLVLAASGAAFDVARAHVVCALLLAAALAAQYLLGRRWLAGQASALGALIATALLPGLWINAKGILSEPLFALLLLAFLRAAEPVAAVPTLTWRRTALLSALLAALVLTRSLGLPVVAAFAAWVAWRHRARWRAALRPLVPPIAAVAAYGAWLLVRPVDTHDEYAYYADAATRWIVDAGDIGAALALRLSTNLQALADAWLGALLLFWSPDALPRVLLAAGVAALALLGAVLRLRLGAPEPWMLAAYVGALLLWPFPGQMTRFLFPLLPVLLLHVFVAAEWIAQRPLPYARLVPVALTVLVASLALPPLAFLHERARLGAAEGHAAITEWYREPDVQQARARADVHLGLLRDMEAIRTRTRPEDRVAWVAPAYIALLADRRALPAPPADAGPAAYVAALERQRPDYLFLSRFHPRDTVSDAAWRTGVAALEKRWTAAYARTDGTGAFQALLLRRPPDGRE